MFCTAETLTLRDGRQCTLRSVEPEDAPRMLQYMKIMLGETPFLLRTPEEFNYTLEEEAAVLTGRRDNPRSLMLEANAKAEDAGSTASLGWPPQGTFGPGLLLPPCPSARGTRSF